MAQGGYYTKGYIAELEELERGSKWAPTHDFCQNFSIRFEEAQRTLEKLKIQGRLRSISEQRFLDLAYSWALFNEYDEIERMDDFMSKINLGAWININTWLHSSNKKDLTKVIKELLEVQETLL